MASELQPGIYNIDYYTGAQVALYIGDILVDEVTSMQFSVSQSKRPLYGYADTLFRQVAKGQVIVQGQFTINFKEAGYLWLVLQNYRAKIAQKPSPFFRIKDEATGKYSDAIHQQNIERIMDNDLSSIDQRTGALKTLAQASALQGFPGGGRSPQTQLKGSLGTAEGLLENFEDAIWGPVKGNVPDELHRRVDDEDLNGFDIYLAYGDFNGQDRANHTIRKIIEVHITGTSQQIVIDGMPLQEQYTFFAKNLV